MVERKLRSGVNFQGTLKQKKKKRRKRRLVCINLKPLE
jgi:hypothetical protein